MYHLKKEILDFHLVSFSSNKPRNGEDTLSIIIEQLIVAMLEQIISFLYIPLLFILVYRF